MAKKKFDDDKISNFKKNDFNSKNFRKMQFQKSLEQTNFWKH